MPKTETTPGHWALWKIGLVAAIVSAVANILLMFLTNSITNTPDTFGPLSVPPIILWSTVFAFGGVGVYALVRKLSSDPHRVFLIVSIVVLAATFIPDLLLINVTEGSFAGAGWAAIIVLMTMHVISFGVIVSMLRKLAR